MTFGVVPANVRRDDKHLQMREIVRERLDLFLAEGVGHIRHCRHRTAGPHARFVIVQRLHEVLLALADRFGVR